MKSTIDYVEILIRVIDFLKIYFIVIILLIDYEHRNFIVIVIFYYHVIFLKICQSCDADHAYLDNFDELGSLSLLYVTTSFVRSICKKYL